MAENYSSTAHRIVTEQLRSLRGPQRHTDTDVWIVCPFHDDSKPSCGVCVAPGIGVPIGFFFCFGCAEKGPWNKLANKLGLTKIKSEDSIESMAVIDHGRMVKRRAKVGMGDLDIEMPAGVAYPYSDWRGISGKTVRDVGGIMAVDMRGDVKLYFPVDRDNDGRYQDMVGVIQARLEKEKDKAGYVLQGGSQVKESGLFPLPKALKMLSQNRSKVLTLVEGPRDALRLVSNGLPTLSIISTTQWSESKAQTVAWICRRHKVQPLSMMDGDKEGVKAQRQVLSDLGKYSFNGRRPARIDLMDYGEDLDPANMPSNLLKSIKRKAIRN